MSSKAEQTSSSSTASDIKAQAGKYLTFRLASENYGVEILKVQEIIGTLPVTRVPKMPEFVRGIINLRGKLIPIIDMRLKFGLPPIQDTEKTCFIIVQVMHRDRSITLGITVDGVSEVVNIQQDQLEPPPSIGSNVDTEYLSGIGKISGHVIILLEIDRLFTGDDTNRVLAA